MHVVFFAGFLLLIVCAAFFFVFDIRQLYSESKLQRKIEYFIENIKNVMIIKKETLRDPIEDTFANYSDRKCHFITFKYMGRTGNQMFEYASFYGLAKGNNKIPFIKYDDFPLLKAFKLSTPTFNISYLNVSTFMDVPDPGAYAFDEKSFTLNCDDNYIMGGYRLSYKYFLNHSEEIKNEFKFIDDIDRVCTDILQNITENLKISRSNCTLIGAHMRRGDFVDPRKQSFGHVPATKVYLETAIDFFETRYSNHSCIFFIIIGDDYNWNLQNSPKRHNIIVFKPRTQYIDLCVLSRCNHTIISSGTYGWWAAYLAGGEATYMSNQCRFNSSLCQELHYDSYINPGWNWFSL